MGLRTDAAKERRPIVSFAWLALFGLGGFACDLCVGHWSGGLSSLLTILGSLCFVLLALAIPFLLVLASGCVGVGLLVGVNCVVELAERRALARVEARVRRAKHGAAVVPAAAPRGRGDEMVGAGHR